MLAAQQVTAMRWLWQMCLLYKNTSHRWWIEFSQDMLKGVWAVCPYAFVVGRGFISRRIFDLCLLTAALSHCPSIFWLTYLLCQNTGGRFLRYRINLRGCVKPASVLVKLHSAKAVTALKKNACHFLTRLARCGKGGIHYRCINHIL